MADHNLCQSCETALWCRRNGCIPITPESAVIGARFSDGGASTNTADAPPLPVSLQQPRPKQESAVMRFLRMVFTN